MADELRQNPDALLSETVRKDQIEYRKWIVSLSTFVLTVSLGLFGVLAKSNPIQYKWLLILGWAFLGASILFNWLIVKNLVTISLVDFASQHDPTFQPLLQWLTKGNLQAYALTQNLAFLLGVLAVALGSILNL